MENVGNIEKREQLYEGKAKKVFKTSDPELYIVSYKDDATALNGKKRGTIVGKGVVNNRMSNYLMEKLESEAGIPTHYVKELSERETLVKKVSIVPLEVIVRNIAAGSFTKRFGVPEGTPLSRPTLEYCYKCDELDDPMINDYQLLSLGYSTEEELKIISSYAFKINEYLKNYFIGIGVELVDFKIEFGKTPRGEIILADEISPDTCRFWDAKTHEKLDKDRFRRDMGGVEDAYREMMKRVLGE